jgi:hypothetical protein
VRRDAPPSRVSGIRLGPSLPVDRIYLLFNFVFALLFATGNHFVLDALAGAALAIALQAFVAPALERSTARPIGSGTVLEGAIETAEATS